MNLQLVTTEIRELLALFVLNVKANTALGLSDLNRLSESFLLELLREVYELPGLHNLNSEKKNFPGLDLGDDASGRAFQITANPTLDKVRDTLATVCRAGLEKRFPKVQIYVLGERQSTYHQSAIDLVTQGRLSFDSASDVLDYRDILKVCSTLELGRLVRVRDVLSRHLDSQGRPKWHGASIPTVATASETVQLNVVPIWHPSMLYIADFVPPLDTKNGFGRGRKRRANLRDQVAKAILERGLQVPEDFEIFDSQIITFQDLTEPNPALKPYFDPGTVTDIEPKEFYNLDEDRLRVFKSLLRRCLQRQLRRDRVQWQDRKHLFFYGFEADEEHRVISWKGEKTAERVVCSKTMKTEQPDQILTCKHLAFEVAFHNIAADWYLSIIPTWYFSRDGYRVDGFAKDRISWLKRKENDQQVHNHFRFIVSRIQELQELSLFDGPRRAAQIQVADPVAFPNHPFLPDNLWNPPSTTRDEPEPGQGRLEL